MAALRVPETFPPLNASPQSRNFARPIGRHWGAFGAVAPETDGATTNCIIKVVSLSGVSYSTRIITHCKFYCTGK